MVHPPLNLRSFQSPSPSLHLPLHFLLHPVVKITHFFIIIIIIIPTALTVLETSRLTTSSNPSHHPSCPSPLPDYPSHPIPPPPSIRPQAPRLLHPSQSPPPSSSPPSQSPTIPPHPSPPRPILSHPYHHRPTIIIPPRCPLRCCPVSSSKDSSSSREGSRQTKIKTHPPILSHHSPPSSHRRSDHPLIGRPYHRELIRFIIKSSPTIPNYHRPRTDWIDSWLRWNPITQPHPPLRSLKTQISIITLLPTRARLLIIKSSSVGSCRV